MKIKQIAEDYEIKLINVTVNNIKRICKEYGIKETELINNAMILYNDTILLGIYDNKNLRLGAFFHELGHTQINKGFLELIDNIFILIEYQAWIEGLKIAKKYGYKFNTEIYDYILNSIHSYYGCNVKYDLNEKEKNTNKT